jgi:hypothetical protein
MVSLDNAIRTLLLIHIYFTKGKNSAHPKVHGV